MKRLYGDTLPNVSKFERAVPDLDFNKNLFAK